MGDRAMTWVSIRLSSMDLEIVSEKKEQVAQIYMYIHTDIQICFHLLLVRRELIFRVTN